MKTGGFVPRFVLIVSALLLISCLLPGMIPLNQDATAEATDASASAEPEASAAPDASMPTMEKDANAVIEALKAGEFVYLQALAEEKYTDEDYAKPGTLTFTVKITDDKPIFFDYGWCTTTEEILQQNFEHIRVALYFDGKLLGRDVVHPISYTRPDNFVCLDFGALLSDWVPGEYKLKAMATFNEKINDGAADFEAGEYIFEYNVTVE